MKATATSLLYGTVTEQLELKFDDILYCQADNNYTNVYVRGYKRPFLFSNTLKLVENCLDRRFYRINRSVLINLEYISFLDINDEKEVKLKNGEEFSLAVRRKVSFKRMIKSEMPRLMRP